MPAPGFAKVGRTSDPAKPTANPFGDAVATDRLYQRYNDDKASSDNNTPPKDPAQMFNTPMTPDFASTLMFNSGNHSEVGDVTHQLDDDTRRFARVGRK